MTEYLSVTMSPLGNSHSKVDTMSIRQKVLSICQPLIKKQGVHSNNVMKAAGFHYTNNKDTARCDACELEISDWTEEMNPFTIHAQRSPACAFVCSLVQPKLIPMGSTSGSTQSVFVTNNAGISCKRQKIETIDENSHSSSFSETRTLEAIRKRTFSHWACPTVFREQMIKAGFFSCDVGDRVICLYCNIICQQWVSQMDDPCELHRLISPKCPYVIATLSCPKSSPIPIVNGNQKSTSSAQLSANDVLSHEQIVAAGVCHVSYREVTKRYASFSTWPNENLPSVDDLVRAGFFYTGAQAIVTCFYCSGSLKNWGPKDNPTTEHARWFPHCAYAKQLCGEKQHRRIQMSKQRMKECHVRNQQNNESAAGATNPDDQRSNQSDNNMLARLVAARLDLPMSQRMLDLNFSLAIIKRCWENQLRIKRDDYVTDTDLLVACQILQKQIKHINGTTANIIIPAMAMDRIREREQTEYSAAAPSTSESAKTNSSNDTDVEMVPSSPPISCKTTAQPAPAGANDKENTNSHDTSLLHPCSVCLTEEKCLACVPCGHVTACVPCGHSLRYCPLCRTEIKAFVRVYI